MSSIIEDILGNGLRILLLGSYDEQTRNMMHQLRLDLNERFERYVCTTLLADNMDVYISLEAGVSDYSIFFENEGVESATVTIMKDKTRPIETLSYKNHEEFLQNIGKDSGTIDFLYFRKVSELEKVLILNDWADLVYWIKDLELTRGGELVELTYLLHHRDSKSNFDPLKYEIFYKEGIEISTMVKEIVSNNRINPTGYNDYEELKNKVIELTKMHISRLNTQIGRFKQFE